MGTQPTPYLDQPYREDATNPVGTGPHLFYLDVWDRELTAIDAEGLVDPAVGVDTTTRLQTVWQVGTLQVPAGTTCATDWSTVQPWVDLTTPSGARLTTADIGTPTSTDPCLVLPEGGYRGIDNRLYRIEIHDDGAAGPATLKWSASNASVAARITGPITGSAAAPVVPVEMIGRDAFLRFRPGDWIELIDRKRELDGDPGVMVKIAPNGVDAVRLELKLEAVTAGVFTQLTNLGDEPRARRWDTRPGDASALIQFTPGTAIDLGDGVQITVDVVGPGVAHTGDYWVFTARAADASVEELDQAPPRGIRHHYCRLAILSGGELEDCRVLYPPECPPAEEGCDCDVCVTPESHEDGSLTIQDAIDQVKATGGKVCLHAGVFVLDRPVRIVGAQSVQLVGKGLSTVLFMRGRGPAIDVYRSVEVTIEHLAVATDGRGDARTEIGIAIRSAAGVTVQRCFVVQAAGFAQETLAVASAPSAATLAALRRGGIGIGLSGLLVTTVIRENVILADIGIGTLTGDRAATWDPKTTIAAEKAAKGARAAKASTFAGVTALARSVFTWGLFIEDNLLACFRVGVDLGRSGRTKGPTGKVRALRTAVIVHLGDTRVAGNTISGCVEAGIVASGVVPADPSALASVLRTLPVGATAAALAGAGAGTGASLGVLPLLGSGLMASSGSRLDILGNLLSIVGHGIVVGCDATRIEGNDVAGQEARRSAPSHGILLLRGARLPIRRALVVENRVTGMDGHGIALDTVVESALIKLNIVDRVGGAGIACIDRARFGTLMIENNLVRAVGESDDESEFVRVGIVAARGDHAELTGNTVLGVGGIALRGAAARAGLLALDVRSARVRGNRVDRLGPDGDFLGAAAGIAVDYDCERIDVSDNEVHLTEVSGSRASALELGMPSREVTVLAALLFTGSGSWTRADGFPIELVLGSPLEKPDGRLVSAHGNHLESDGASAVVFVSTTGTCHFADNRVVGRRPGDLIGSILAGAGAVVNANTFSSDVPTRLQVEVHAPPAGTPPPATIVGNLGPSDILLTGGFGPPWDAINVPR